MYAFHLFFGGLMGILNAIVYGLNEQVKIKLKQKVFYKCV